MSKLKRRHYRRLQGEPLARRIRWGYFWWLPRWTELRYSWLDVKAAARGYCNDKPWTPDERGGGYAHWRCAFKRGHDGLHRFNNYIWDDGASVYYAPSSDALSPPYYSELTGQTYMQRRHRDRFYDRMDSAS
jgi:hypothetical protein